MQLEQIKDKAYRYRLWTSLHERMPVSQESGKRQMSFDEEKEKLAYEKTCEAWDKELEMLLAELKEGR